MYVTRQVPHWATDFSKETAAALESAPVKTGAKAAFVFQQAAQYGPGGIPLKSQKAYPIAILNAWKNLDVIWRNPHFTKVPDGDEKQCLLFGKNIYRKYKKNRAAGKSQKMEIGRGRNNVILSKGNPCDSVYMRFPLYVETRFGSPYHAVMESLETIQEEADMLNRLAAVFLEDDEETNAMRGHFAIEVITKVRGYAGTGRGFPVYVTPIVEENINLHDYLCDPSRYAAELPLDVARVKIDELKKAVAWLAKKGFKNGDLKPDNVLYDLKNKKMLIFDFEITFEFSPASAEHVAEALEEFRQQIEVAILPQGIGDALAARLGPVELAKHAPGGVQTQLQLEALIRTLYATEDVRRYIGAHDSVQQMVEQIVWSCGDSDVAGAMLLVGDGSLSLASVRKNAASLELEICTGNAPWVPLGEGVHHLFSRAKMAQGQHSFLAGDGHLPSINVQMFAFGFPVQ